MNLSTVPLSACSPSAISAPVVFGAEILSLSASWVSNFTLYVPAEFNYNHGDVAVNNAEFCNITVAYTHPGTGDHITVETWLPRTGWNERLQATGGGGWQAGRWLLSEFFMAGAIGEGYATTTTDGGLGDATTPDTWALISPGNVDLYTLRDFGYKALEDQAIIGKSLVKSFYGREPAYSYWSGCSQGGRQGLMLAQRYPTAYDGIAASAPAQSWTQLISSTVYPGLLTNWIGEYALACELDFLTEKAIADCDPKDGIVDGIISDMDVCDFNPFSMVNESFHCASTGKTMKLSQAGAVVADAVWGGPRSADGKFLWYGMNYGANISSYGLASPNSSTQNQDDLWFRWFMEMNPDYNASTMTHEQFDWFFHLAIDMYTDVLGANDPDLTAFQKAGGKLISYHGMADAAIPTKDTEHYYRETSKATPDVQEFFRFFEAPGLGHCSGGIGGQPKTVFDALRTWVENGTAPDTLPVQFTGIDGVEQERILCPYPAKAVYQGGNSSLAASFRCV